MSDSRPVVLIPAYKPRTAILTVVRDILASDTFQGVVCVDDGSGEEYWHLFLKLAEQKVTVIRHLVNLGKGMALRTGMNVIACNYPSAVGVVTVDADGQHLSEDVVAVGQTLQRNPGTLIMGCRNFGGEIPARSRFGNIVTRHILGLLTGINSADTQTGLRGIPSALIPTLLRLSTSGYDFELEMLIKSHRNIPIKEVPISTVYIDKNQSSHFRPLLDSISIYFVLFRHASNSVITAGLDYIVFAGMLALDFSIFVSMIGGRLIAGLFNFFVGKTLVFRSQKKLGPELVGYAMLVVLLMLLSFAAIMMLVEKMNFSPYLAKLIVESVVFFLAFAVQRVFVFGGGRTNKVETVTDWDRYYQTRQASGSSTRKITNWLLLSLLSRKSTGSFRSITELGGGDSCFYEFFRKQYPHCRYVVADKSAEGIAQFLLKYGTDKVEATQIDLLAPSSSLCQAELVYSVGLIEHFDQSGTARIIKAHFDAALPGALVLITYPTPTISYRVIRGAAEVLGIWRFHDERPLKFAEVEVEIKNYGTIVSRETNWYIGLTQEIILAIKYPSSLGAASSVPVAVECDI